MKKLVAVTAFSLSIICCSAPRCAAQNDNANKRSLAMTGLGMPPLPHPVTVHAVPATLVSKALLRKKALQAYPRTHFDRGIYFKKKGNLDAALIEFLKSTQENPHTVRAFYEQALLFHQKHFLKLAESSLEQALAVKGDYQEARILLATIHLEQGNIGGAMQELGRSLGLELTTPEKLFAPNSVPAKEKTSGQPGAGMLERAPAVLQTLHAALKVMPTFFSVGKPRTDSDSSPPAEKPPGNVGFAMKPYPVLPPKPRAAAAEKTRALSEKPVSPDEKPALEPEQDPAKEGAAEQNIIMVQMQKSLRFFQKHKSAKAEETEKPKSSASAQEREKPKSISHTAGTDAEEKPNSGTKSHRWFLHRSSEQQDESESKGAQFNRAENKTEQNSSSTAGDKADQQSAEVKPQIAMTRLRRNEDAEKSPVALKFEPADPSEAPRAERKVFRVPDLPSKSSAVLAPLVQQAPEPVAPPEPPEDDWTKRLKYLAQNGTSSLKDGEAFMFAEDTGEATMFLPNGETIRRMVAGPRDAKEVVKERRPDILIPEELLYNLQLLGKLMPKAEEMPQSKSANDQSKDEAPNFQFHDLMGKSEGLWGWFKNVFKL